MAQTGRSLTDLSSCVVKLPQVLVNVSGVDKDGVASSDAVTQAVEEAESKAMSLAGLQICADNIRGTTKGRHHCTVMTARAVSYMPYVLGAACQMLRTK